jgi:hypothetical protein
MSAPRPSLWTNTVATLQSAIAQMEAHLREHDANHENVAKHQQNLVREIAAMKEEQRNLSQGAVTEKNAQIESLEQLIGTGMAWMSADNLSKLREALEDEKFKFAEARKKAAGEQVASAALVKKIADNDKYVSALLRMDVYRAKATEILGYMRTKMAERV